MNISLDGIKVMIGIPCGRNPDWDTVGDLVSTVVRLCDIGQPWKTGWIKGGIVTKVRDKIVDEFLRSDCNRLFMIDDDQRWQPDDFMRLLALSTQVDCVTAAYAAKKDHPTFFIKPVAGETPRQLSELGLWEIEGIGLGFACMTREVVEAVAKNKPVAFDQMDGAHYRVVFRTDINEDGNFRGEDMAFFADIREAGFKVWCDPSIELGHIGTKEYRGKLLDVLTAKQPESAVV